MFSSSNSKSSSKSESYDNRSIASESAIAAGGNRGSIARDVFGDKVFQPGGGFGGLRTAGVVLAAALVVWKFPAIKKAAKKLIGK